MFIHPEVQQQFIYEKRKMAHNKPGLAYDDLCEAVRTKLWAENLASTEILLDSLIGCPVTWISSEVWDDEQDDTEKFERETDRTFDELEDE